MSCNNVKIRNLQTIAVKIIEIDEMALVLDGREVTNVVKFLQ